MILFVKYKVKNSATQSYILIVFSFILCLIAFYLPHTNVITGSFEESYSLQKGVEHFLFSPERPISLDRVEKLQVVSYFSIFLLPLWFLLYKINFKNYLILFLGIGIHLLFGFMFILSRTYGRLPNWYARINEEELIYSYSINFFVIISIHFGSVLLLMNSLASKKRN